MTDTKALLELAARCEAATGADRDLDALIHCAHRGLEFVVLATGDEAYGEICDPGDSGYGGQNKCTAGLLYARYPKGQRGRFGGGREGNAVQGCTPGRYTASLDAAMMLVPEGWNYAFSSNLIRPGNVAGLQRPDNFAAADATAATPALALCAAALKARAHGDGV